MWDNIIRGDVCFFRKKNAIFWLCVNNVSVVNAVNNTFIDDSVQVMKVLIIILALPNLASPFYLNLEQKLLCISLLLKEIISCSFCFGTGV